jgi:hypothetical protein
MSEPSMGVETRFYLDKIITQVDEATKMSAIEIANAVEGETKLNIRDNGQIDTGFMVNSVFVVRPDSSGYSAAKAAAEAQNPKAVMAPEPAMEGDAQAGVGVGAEYAIYQEVKKAFLYPAAQKIAEQAGATVVKVMNEMVKDDSGNWVATGNQVTE